MNPLTNEILFKKFEIISCYKKDEHSAVYLAKHIYLDKKVFLKVLNTETIPDSSINERFKREAKILAQLEHPNIIKVFDFGMFKEHFYISFEYFESLNLREVLGSNNISVENKKGIFVQLVKGLNFAHGKNVIHRDIKPENILVNGNNEVKLTDFGLAQDSLDNLITQRYSVVGTPAYMSPEQIQGEKLTIQSDMFSLGITAVELFSGKNPFIGRDSNETINNIISFDEQNNEELYLYLPDEIKKVLKGLLAADPGNRFISCTEILEILNIEREIPKNSSNKKNKKYWLIPSLVIVVIVGLWLVNMIFQSSESDKNIAESIDTLQKNSETLDTFDENMETILIPELTVDNSPDDKVNDTSAEIDKSILQESTISNKFGEFYIKCYPWAKVYLNNKFMETTPLTKNIITKSGSYLLTLIHPDYPKYSDSINIKPEELFFIEVNLDTLFGYFECQVYPWSEIYIDGEKKGVTPLNFPIRLNEGSYKLTLKNPQYKSIESAISIKKKDTLRMTFKMNDLSIN